MKISLVIEAETPEDFERAMATLGVRILAQVPDAAFSTGLEAAPKPKPEDKPKPTQPQEPEPAATFPEGTEITAPGGPHVPAAEAPKETKKGRGRPKREAAAPAAGAASAASPAPAVTITAPSQVNGGIEDMRANLMKVFAAYVQKYGTNFGYGDVSKLLQDNFGPEVRKSSDVTDDNLVKAVIVVQSAIEANPFGRKVASAQ